MTIPDMDDGHKVDETWWRKAAQATIRRYCGWHVAPSIEQTLRLDSYGGRRLLLPSKHVTAVSSVVADGVDITDRTHWSQAGILQTDAGTILPDMPGGVQVTLTHGYEPAEAPDVIMLMETIARRARSQGLIASQSVNGASVSYLTAGGAPLSIPLLGIEQQLLDPYRLNWGVVG